MSLNPWMNPWGDDGYPYWPAMRPARFFEDLGRMIRNVDDMCRIGQQMENSVQRHVCGATTEVVNNDDKFEVALDVKHFKPEELTVKTIDNRLVITGKHEEKQDEHGFIKREFTRSYYLPKGVKPEQFTSNLSPDGKLIVTAPKMAIEGSKEHRIPIANVAANKK
ncbi:Heat shock protein beta-1 [Trichinella patagoniensis]|uniref:Heat shock protein beta-1 n=1 Tax=Trichinella patagoniensis TaxID=990121 RepID=A0A0V1A5G8_9BILA|nr:Heat shock protein beta-1 [Trichinella patagoniensis]